MAADTGTDKTGRKMDGSDAGGRDSPGSDAGSPHPDPLCRASPDPKQLARDWITLWQSEISAMAADPEYRESWQAIMALWAGTMSAMVRGLPRETYEGPPRPARPHDAPRPAPAPAAPDARDAEIERLARHIAALEHRLAELERGGDPAVDPKRRPGRKPRT